MIKHRKQIVECLIQAATFLYAAEDPAPIWNVYSTKKKSHICNAIELTNVDKTIKELTIAEVQKRIKPYSSVYEWLRASGVPANEAIRERMQDFRHAWVQEMIKEFQS